MPGRAVAGWLRFAASSPVCCFAPVDVVALAAVLNQLLPCSAASYLTHFLQAIAKSAAGQKARFVAESKPNEDSTLADLLAKDG